MAFHGNLRCVLWEWKKHTKYKLQDFFNFETGSNNNNNFNAKIQSERINTESTNEESDNK